MTASLLAWVAASGLDVLRLGAAEAGVHEVDGATVRRR
ncbi:hypothetical protein M2158_000401 [Streptomyces sp. SAI-144]|nr:hypothetical protein [Streptomyces sp. SAI-144]